MNWVEIGSPLESTLRFQGVPKAAFPKAMLDPDDIWGLF